MTGGDKNKGVKKSNLGRLVASKIADLRNSNKQALLKEIDANNKKSILERSNVDEFVANLIATKDLPKGQKIFSQPQHNNFTIDYKHSKRFTYPIVPIPKRPIIYHKINQDHQTIDKLSILESSCSSSVTSSSKNPVDIPTDSELIDVREDSIPGFSDESDTDSEVLVVEDNESESSDSQTVSNSNITDSFDKSSDFDYLKNTNIGDIHMVKYCIELKNNIKRLTSKHVNRNLNRKELEELELESFYEWRRILSKIEEHENLAMTPYEKNIEFWRQLWRVVERSHLLCIVIDARNPLFYRILDLEYYVKQVDSRKDILLILNKSDFLTKSQRHLWANYFKKLEVNFIFVSALRELYSQSAITISTDDGDLLQENVCNPAYGNIKFETGDDQYNLFTIQQLLDFFVTKKEELSLLYDTDEWIVESGIPQFVVGFIGYPNVGKSSLINSILGFKRVSVSEQPGKTKHFQTIQIEVPGITLCDCPGLIFPSIISSRYHLLVNGIASIHQFRGQMIPAVQIICDLMPLQICKKFRIPLVDVTIRICNKSPSTSKINNNLKCRVNASLFLEKLCESRKFTSSGKGGQYDFNRACRLILSNYISGHLLHVHLPPDSIDSADCILCKEIDINRKSKTPILMNDFDEWLKNECPDDAKSDNLGDFSGMTKRKLRFLRKKAYKSNTRIIGNF